MYLRDRKCKVFYAPFDVHFFKKGFKEPDVMQPDLLIACDIDNNVNEEGRYMGTPTLVVEILSPSTRSKDTVDKLNTGMISGVREYWIVDPDKKLILVYRFTDYELEEYCTYKQADTIYSLAFPDLTIAVEDIFHT